MCNPSAHRSILLARARGIDHFNVRAIMAAFGVLHVRGGTYATDGVCAKLCVTQRGELTRPREVMAHERYGLQGHATDSRDNGHRPSHIGVEMRVCCACGDAMANGQRATSRPTRHVLATTRQRKHASTTANTCSTAHAMMATTA